MLSLNDLRLERFAQLVAAGWTQAGAYRSAGLDAGGPNTRKLASDLMKRNGVRRRVQEIRAQPGWEAAAAALENPRWERFAQSVAGGSALTEAYLAAGFNDGRKAAGTHGSALAKKRRVRNRVNALLAERLRTLHGEEAAAAAATPLTDARRERFAQSVAAGSSLTAAYRDAGYESSTENAPSDASRMAKRTCVRERVSALRELQLSILRAKSAETETAAGIDFHWLRTNGVRLLDASIGEDNAVASRTLERIARICGYWMEKAPPEDFEYKVGDVTVRVSGCRAR